MSLLKDFRIKIRPKLAQEKGANVLAVPQIQKITVNVGLGSRRANSKIGEIITGDLALITGQKPVPKRAKKAIAGFKLRQNEVVGYQVTLRGQRMYDFLDRLISIVLPRIRDFKGLFLDKLDQQGNYTFGIQEHTVFPEIDPEKVTEHYGISVAITTTTKNREDSKQLLIALGLPFKLDQKEKNNG